MANDFYDWALDRGWTPVPLLRSNRFVGGNRVRVRIANFTVTPFFVYTIRATSSCGGYTETQAKPGFGLFGYSGVFGIGEWTTFTAPGTKSRDLVAWEINLGQGGSPVSATMNPHATPQNPQARSTRSIPTMLGLEVQTNGPCY
jgi:hypothetical protein